MTITMNTSIFPSGLSIGGPELAKEDLQEFVNLGLVTRTNNHIEHYAIQPCWTHDPADGVMEAINKNVLGKWSNRLNAYVVAVKNIRNFDKSSGMNEDHRWLHVDIVATFYTFCPEVGQRFKGEIKKIGNRAAICIIFDVFTATVFSNEESELSTWTVGDELRFEITSFIHRRKGPILRAKSISESVSSKRKLDAIEYWGDEETGEVNGLNNSLNESGDFEESQGSEKKKKKKKKKKWIKEEAEEVLEDENEFQSTSDLFHEYSQDHAVVSEEEILIKKKKKKKRTKEEADETIEDDDKVQNTGTLFYKNSQDYTVKLEEETPSKKKKKKKKSSHND